MAHFNFETTVSDATRLTGAVHRGPMMRWQRKAMETGVRSLSVSDSKLLEYIFDETSGGLLFILRD